MNTQPFPSKLFSGTIFILIFTFLFSCKKSQSGEGNNNMNPIITNVGVPNGAATSSSIGASGGIITSADGKLSVSIPQGALSSNTTISIQPISNEGPLGLGSAYRLSPENIRFNQPVKLIFHYDNQLLAGVPEDFLWLITQQDDGSWNALLKSMINKTEKTVTVSTDHFSDWTLGRFIDLALTPSSKTLKKGESVQLQVTGFARNSNSGDDELAPLVPIRGSGEGLTPLTPIPAPEARLLEFRLKGWSLNGASAPVSGSSGSLNPSGLSATYKAPNSRPPRNPVAVSASLESTDQQGRKQSYLLTSNISIVDADLFLLLTVDGTTYEYYQYGFNGTVPPDPNNLTIANCGIDANMLSIAGTHVQNNSNLISSFVLSVKNPTSGTLTLNCLLGSGQDEAQFTLGSQQAVYDINQYIRTKKPGGNCDVVSKCANIAITFTDYENKPMGRVAGFFSGVLYEDKPGFSDDCENPIAHNITGEFWLTRAN